MRFLSKRVVWLFVVVIAFSAVVFFHNATMCKCEHFNLSIVNTSAQSKDDTVFNLRYKNKVWTFKASEFELNSKVFSIDERINRFERNGTREDKIKLINKLIEINIAPEIAFNYIYFGFNNKLNKIQKNIEKLPKDAEIKIKNNKINIVNEIIGIKFDKYLFYNNLIKLYLNNQKIINIDIPTIKSIPNITRESLKRYTHKRSEFSTSIATSSSGRKYNVRKALNAINGIHLSKTEKFSFNNIVGRRTADKGYKNARIILDGEFVEGVGGGVCQVSSTLYNAVLLAGLNVTSAQKHSQRVSYVKAGFDAMVNYGTSDLVFENNTEGDIYILCKYTDDSITISIYGADLQNVSYDRCYEIVNPVMSEPTQIIHDTEGKYADKVTFSDEFFELKKSRDGYTIKSYLIKRVNGKDVSKTLLRTDKYLPQQGVIVYGVQQRNMDLNIYEAISSEED